VPTTPASTRPRGGHRRRLAATFAVVLGLTALTACEPDITPPTWNVSTVKVTPVPTGPHVALDWNDATDATRYQVQVARITSSGQGPWRTHPMDTPATSGCLLVGLDAMVEHSIRITAFDAAGNWSGDITGPMTYGAITVRYTPPNNPTGGGNTFRCLSPADVDADRVFDALERGTTVPIGATNLGTLPTSTDSDADGLRDGDEAYGTVDGLDLPAFGVRPAGKDILLEIDWAATPPGCTTALRPTADVVEPVRSAFTQVSVTALGSTGINLIVDRGQGGVFTGGNEFTGGDGQLRGAGDYEPRPDHFAPERDGYFRYARIGTDVFIGGSRVAGAAVRNGADLWLGFGCTSGTGLTVRQHLLMHEIGHLLGLGHGGHENANYKPNYGSIMNYRYLTNGADVDCDGRSDTGIGRLSYSEELRPPFDENDIDEVAGICPGVPADIDWDDVIDTVPYARDMNLDGRITVFQGSNDLDHIDVAAFARTGPNPTMGDLIADPFPVPLP
jgi:hypothetical protein